MKGVGGMAKNVGGIGKMMKGYGIGKMHSNNMEDENKKNMVKSNELLSKLGKK